MLSVSPLARAARARVRGVRGAGAIALREFSGRVAAAAGGDAAARRGASTPSRASPTTSPTKARRRPAERQAQLDAWQRRLHARRRASDAVGRRRRTRDEDLIVVALAPFDPIARSAARAVRRSLSAFGQDTMTTRYASWADVFDYCRRSANPVGRLVLRIAGYRDEALDRSSDALCTALQLTNFWQDFGRDWRAGRLYVPRDVQAACGAREDDLGGAAA